MGIRVLNIYIYIYIYIYRERERERERWLGFRCLEREILGVQDIPREKERGG